MTRDWNKIGDFDSLDDGKNRQIEDLANRLQDEIDEKGTLENSQLIIDEFNESSYVPMSREFKKGDKVIVIENSNRKGKTFTVQNPKPTKNGNIILIEEGENVGFAMPTSRIVLESMYDENKDYSPRGEFTSKVVDYENYESLDDIKIEGKEAIVISNDKDKRKIIVEYIDSSEMESIQYKKGGYISSKWFSGELSFLNW